MNMWEQILLFVGSGLCLAAVALLMSVRKLVGA